MLNQRSVKVKVGWAEIVLASIFNGEKGKLEESGLLGRFLSISSLQNSYEIL